MTVLDKFLLRNSVSICLSTCSVCLPVCVLVVDKFLLRNSVSVFLSTCLCDSGGQVLLAEELSKCLSTCLCVSGGHDDQTLHI